MGYILVGTIIGGIIWGIVVNKVIENKGYEENWFWWGFFFGIFALIIALTKQSVNASNECVCMKYGVKVIYTYSVGEDCRKYYEEQMLAVNARTIDEAFEKAEKYAAEYDTEHTNPKGELVKTEKVEFTDCFLAFDEENDIQEIYSSITKNISSLSDDEFYNLITYQSNVEELYDLRYKESRV